VRIGLGGGSPLLRGGVSIGRGGVRWGAGSGPFSVTGGSILKSSGLGEIFAIVMGYLMLFGALVLLVLLALFTLLFGVFASGLSHLIWNLNVSCGQICSRVQGMKLRLFVYLSTTCLLLAPLGYAALVAEWTKDSFWDHRYWRGWGQEGIQFQATLLAVLVQILVWGSVATSVVISLRILPRIQSVPADSLSEFSIRNVWKGLSPPPGQMDHGLWSIIVFVFPALLIATYRTQSFVPAIRGGAKTNFLIKASLFCWAAALLCLMSVFTSDYGPFGFFATTLPWYQGVRWIFVLPILSIGTYRVGEKSGSKMKPARKEKVQGGRIRKDYQRDQLVVGGMSSFLLAGIFLFVIAVDLRIGGIRDTLAMIFIGICGLSHLLIALRELLPYGLKGRIL